MRLFGGLTGLFQLMNELLRTALSAEYGEGEHTGGVDRRFMPMTLYAYNAHALTPVAARGVAHPE